MDVVFKSDDQGLIEQPLLLLLVLLFGIRSLDAPCSLIGHVALLPFNTSRLLLGMSTCCYLVGEANTTSFASILLLLLRSLSLSPAHTSAMLRSFRFCAFWEESKRKEGEESAQPNTDVTMLV